MTQALPNLFRRQDTLFGTFEGIGQDFGINPLWLRLGFVVPLFFFPAATLLAYLGLSVAVFAARWFFPDKAIAAPAQPVVAIAAEAQMKPAEQEMALAA